MSTPAPDDTPAAIARAARLIDSADGLVIAAGAGMGVDSGLPDFRSDGGFWRAYPALAASGTRFIEIAAPAAFLRRPRLAWGFYGHRLALYRQTVPHAGFGLLRRWGAGRVHGGFVFTSNVDGQFQAAGFDPARIEECHGSIHALQCMTPCSDATWPATPPPGPIDPLSCEWPGALPACPRCGGLARPNILMFNDSGWIEDRHEAQARRRQAWLARVRRPVVIELGAGLDIPSVRHFAQQVVLRHGGALVRINPRDAGIGPIPGVALAGGALATLHAIEAYILKRRLTP